LSISRACNATKLCNIKCIYQIICILRFLSSYVSINCIRFTCSTGTISQGKIRICFYCVHCQVLYMSWRSAKRTTQLYSIPLEWQLDSSDQRELRVIPRVRVRIKRWMFSLVETEVTESCKSFALFVYLLFDENNVYDIVYLKWNHSI